MAKSFGDDGIEDQYAVSTLENSAEYSSSPIAPLLMVNKNTHRGHARTGIGESKPLHWDPRTDAERVIVRTIAVAEKTRAGKSHRG